VNRKDVREMILKATFRRPTRGDLDLSSLPGGLPPMSNLKIVAYNEDGWTDKRKETLEKIKDLLAGVPLSVTGIVIEGVTRTSGRCARSTV
jgi:iron(III) transport system substrate-binding protein